MKKRWCFYILALLTCFVFYIANGLWLSWLLLCLIAGLPILSVMLCLLEICFLKPSVQLPESLVLGQNYPLNIRFARTSMMSWRYWVEITNTLTGKTCHLDAGDHFPTEQCGVLSCVTKGLYVTDYLGLFHLRLLPGRQWQVPVHPVAMEMPLSNDAQRLMAHSWQPKPGGGFSEQHDLRQYRPGDSLNQIHWKLSAKTGKYIIREAMIPCHGKAVVTLFLRGTGEELNEKLGNLLWLGKYLLQMEMSFELRALTAQGQLHWPIGTEQQLQSTIDELLFAGTAEKDAVMDPVTAAWHCHIGGDYHET